MKPESERKLQGKVAQVAVGVRSLFKWWTGGKPPVPQWQAIKRSEACLVCPLNRPETDFEVVTGTFASLAKEVIAFKHKRNMVVPDEHLLGVCAACGCDLKLKIHVPMEHILETMTEEQLNALDSKCWIERGNQA